MHGQNPFEKYATFRELVYMKQKIKTETEKKLKYAQDDLEQEKLLQLPGKLCRFCQKKFPEEEFKFHWELHKVKYLLHMLFYKLKYYCKTCRLILFVGIF